MKHTGLTNTVLTGSEITAIIEICAKAKVRSFSYGGLRLEFGEGIPEKLPMARSEAIEPKQPTEAAPSVKHDKINKDTLEVEEALSKEERLALMLIENPLEAENLILNGDLSEEDGDARDEDEE